MWNTPTSKQLAKIPTLYSNDKNRTPLQEIIIHQHFFIGGCDWYIAEFDGEDIFFGFVILNDDTINAEWGNFPFQELKDIKVQGVLEIDCDQYWEPKLAQEVAKIAECQGWNIE